MIWLEEKYISLLGPRLLRFSRAKQNSWAFRCPICGDSKKNEWKTRGSFYRPANSNHYVMGCFNCGASMRFTSFLKMQDTYLYDEYTVEKYKINHVETVAEKVIDKPVENKRLNISDLQCVADLADDHPAVKYLTKRKIDKKHFSRLYFVLRFKTFESEWRAKKMLVKDDHPRLIIPFFDKQGNITRLSARTFGKEEPKYIYMKIKDDASRIFGLDTVDIKKRTYVLEGPLDSLFFDNAIAVGSADLAISELSTFNDVVLVPDNQPRNVEVCKSIRKMADSGYKVCLWNDNWGKDINEMILNGKSIADIEKLIMQSSEQGIAAKMKFDQWVRCKL